VSDSSIHDNNFLLGAWQLLGWEIAESNSDKRLFPFGDNPQGLITYTADGWMSATVSCRQRNKLSTEGGLRNLPAQLLAEAYKSYFHYAGTYQLQSDRVIHAVTTALNPNMVGTEQVRFFDISDGVLTLRGEEPCGSNFRYHTLRWQRA